MRFEDVMIINVHSVLEVSFQPRFAVNRLTFKRIQTEGSFGTQKLVQFHMKNTGFRWGKNSCLWTLHRPCAASTCPHLSIKLNLAGKWKLSCHQFPFLCKTDIACKCAMLLLPCTRAARQEQQGTKNYQYVIANGKMWVILSHTCNDQVGISVIQFIRHSALPHVKLNKTF
jgi:hypothetical protein